MTYFADLTEEENEIIAEARARGFARFFAAFPNARTQSNLTLDHARQYLAAMPPLARSAEEDRERERRQFNP